MLEGLKDIVENEFNPTTEMDEIFEYDGTQVPVAIPFMIAHYEAEIQKISRKVEALFAAQQLGEHKFDLMDIMKSMNLLEKYRKLVDIVAKLKEAQRLYSKYCGGSGASQADDASESVPYQRPNWSEAVRSKLDRATDDAVRDAATNIKIWNRNYSQGTLPSNIAKKGRGAVYSLLASQQHCPATCPQTIEFLGDELQILSKLDFPEKEEEFRDMIKIDETLYMNGFNCPLVLLEVSAELFAICRGRIEFKIVCGEPFKEWP